MTLRTSLPLLVAAVSIAGLLLAKGLFSSFGPELILNLTNSVPLGIYRLSPLDQLRKGEYVAFIPPARVRQIAEGRSWFRKDSYFIKQIAAVAGDQVCIEKGQISIDGKDIGPVFETDRLGVLLPHHEGCTQVPLDSAFLVGPGSEWSFDSRYFGVLRYDELFGKAVQIW